MSMEDNTDENIVNPVTINVNVFCLQFLVTNSPWQSFMALLFLASYLADRKIPVFFQLNKNVSTGFV